MCVCLCVVHFPAKSYPHGYAQLVESPVGFRVEPMQIDTRNRDGSMQSPKDGFHPDPKLVPKAYAAPLTGPDAVYSGLLECPCTDRISKVVNGGYSLQATGTALKKGLRRIVTSPECYTAAGKLGLPPAAQAKSQGSDPALPAGCSVTIDPNTGKQRVFFNHLEKAAACGAAKAGTKDKGGAHFVGAKKSLVNLGLHLDATAPGGNATITVTGPATVWFGVAFGQSSEHLLHTCLVYRYQQRVLLYPWYLCSLFLRCAWPA